ncbi:ribonuclease H-like domain-containing protein [Tanacetum coccineum]
MLLSPQHAGFGDQQEMLLTISPTTVDHTCLKDLTMLIHKGNPQYALQDQGIFDSGCSRHITGNKFYLFDYQDIDGGFVAFAGSTKGGKITRKGKIRTEKLNFEDVYFVKELKFNLFSVSQMCDKKNSVLFTETECLVLSPDFKLLDESQVLLKVPRQNKMYSFNLKNVGKGLTYLLANAIIDESNLWHRRLGHINFKTMNKLVKGNLVRFLKMTILVLHVRRESNAKLFFCGMKGIKREFSVARTPQQNRVAERKNRTLIEAARTMLADSLLPTTFWAEAVSTTCYVQNRVLVTKPHNKTPYELLLGTQSTDDKDADEVPDKGNHNVSQRNSQEKEGGASNKEDDQHVQDFRVELDNLLVQQNMQSLENLIFDDAYDDRELGVEADLNNLETTMNVSPIPTTRIHKDHPIDQIIGDINSSTQTKRMTKISKEHAMKVIQALTDLSWIEAMQEELLQFKLQKVWTLVDLPKGKRAIGTKWVYRNKKDERGIVVRNKARLVAQDESVLCGQPSGFEDPQFPNKVYKMMHKRFQMSSIRELTFFLGLQVQQKEDGIFISQDKYVADILKKFDFVTVKTASTPMEPNKALVKDEEAVNVDVHLYRSMIGSLMYLTASRLDITFVVCACARFQVTPKVSQLHADRQSSMVGFGEMRQLEVLRATVWRHSQVADADGISVLPNTEIFDQLTLMGYVLTDDKLTFQKAKEGEGSGNPSEPQPPLSTAQLLMDVQSLILIMCYPSGEAVDSVERADTMYKLEAVLTVGLALETELKQTRRSMIGSLMYLTSSRPDIMFAVCACARYQVNPKVSHLHAVKRIFRYLKGQPKLGLWYPKDSPFDLVAYTDSDYALELAWITKSTTVRNVADLLTKAFDLYLILLGKAKKSVKLMMEKLFRMELELMLVTQS